MKRIIYLILILLLIEIVLALPPTFHQFYGTVKYSDGTNAVDDALITARVNDLEFSTVTSQGKYGYSPLFFVENANNGDVIKFYVNGIKKAEYLFEDSSTTQLNLLIADNCGDTLCTGSESCSSCPADCGACPSGGDTGGGSGGGGGGGGGGAGHVSLCTENWECGEWSLCSVDEVQRRTCEDKNNCGTIENKPAEIRKCVYGNVSEEIPEEKKPEETFEEEKELKIPIIEDERKDVNILIITTLVIFLILMISTYKLIQSKKKHKK